MMFLWSPFWLEGWTPGMMLAWIFARVILILLVVYAIVLWSRRKD